MSEHNLISIDDAPKDVAGKLIKLLANAKHGADAERTKNEVEAALSLAKKYAIRHQIDLASIKEATLDGAMQAVSTEPFIKEQVRTAKGGSRRPPCNKYLVWILQRHFNVECTYHGSTVGFFGRQSDVIFAKYAYEYLHREFTRIWRQYKRAHDAPMSERNSVFYGIYVGLDEKLHTAAKEASGEAATEAASKTGVELGTITDRYQLMVVDAKEEMDREFKKAHPLIRYVKQGMGNLESYSGIDHGRSKGAEITVCAPLEQSNSGKIG